MYVRPVELVRHDQLRLKVEEAEALRQHADNFTWFGIDHEALPDGRSGAAEVRLPISICQNHRRGAAVLAVLQREEPPQHRPLSEQRKRSIGDVERGRLFRFTMAGD